MFSSSPTLKSFVIKPLALAALVLGSSFAGPADAEAAAAARPFPWHQALYDLNLVKARGANINSARGRILYTFPGSPVRGLHLGIPSGLGS